MVSTDVLKAWEAKLQTAPAPLRVFGGTPRRRFETWGQWMRLRRRLREPKPWVLANEVTRTAPQGEDLDCAVHAINNSLQLSGEDGITNTMVQDISQQLVALNHLKVARQENFATMEINQVRAPHRFSHPLGPHAISPHQAIVELGYAPLDVAAMEKKSVEVELQALLQAHCTRFRVLVPQKRRGRPSKTLRQRSGPRYRELTRM